MTQGWRRLDRVGEEGWEQVGGHERVGVGERGVRLGMTEGLEGWEGVLRVRMVFILPL